VAEDLDSSRRADPGSPEVGVSERRVSGLFAGAKLERHRQRPDEVPARRRPAHEHEAVVDPAPEAAVAGCEPLANELPRFAGSQAEVALEIVLAENGHTHVNVGGEVGNRPVELERIERDTTVGDARERGKPEGLRPLLAKIGERSAQSGDL
jgi:hypothetical protein